jgi:adenine-specific DNA-methyltransferase
MPVVATTKADKSQGRFCDALTDLFVGAKVEGQSGFINPMRIKERYYTKGVFPRQQEDIEAAPLPAGR